MSWFDEQIKTRHRLDQAGMEDAYARLAASVMGSSRAPHFTLDDAAAADSAIDAVTAYYGAKATAVPDNITDPMERVDWAVRPAGIMRRPVRLEGTWWKDATGTYLAAFEDGTPVAIIPHGMRGYGYVDPVTQRKVRVNGKTAKHFLPEALCFYRPLPQRELSVADVGRFMTQSLDWGDYALIVVSMAVTTLIGLLPAIANRVLFAHVIPSGLPFLIFPIAGLLVGMTISQVLIQATSTIITSRLGTKLQVQMEAATYARILMLPPTFFRDFSAGDLANRAMGMSELVVILSRSVIGSFLTGVFSLAYIFQTIAFAPRLTLPALVVVLAQAAASTLLTFRTMQYSRRQMETEARLNGLTPSLLHGIQKIKLAGAERRAFAHWAHAYADVADATYGLPPLLLAGPSLVPLIAIVGTVVIYYLAATTKVSIADYMAFNSAFGSASGAISQIAASATTIASLRPLLEMIEPVMKAVPESVGGKRQLESISGSVEVSNLSFAYDDKGPLVLDDISLRIRPGEYVAIVGRTGCGKSTLVRLMLGFETPQKGSVYYGGQDISSIDVRSLRRNIGVVMQSGSLFQGDILMNITVASPKATLVDAWEAAQIAGIADDIARMPMGMNTLISEGGGGISGGQRQRILIARAVCGKPKILLLDEATSALDNITQKHVSDALERLKCTRIVVAHRLSTIRNADRIVMMDGGHIVEDGTYDELMARDGAFADLVRRQRLEGE